MTRLRRGVPRERRPFGPFLVPSFRGAGSRGARGASGRARLLVMALVVALVATIMVGRLVQLQIVDGAKNATAAADINTRDVVVPAQRGRILAADGTVLVGNGSTTTLTISPQALARDDAPKVIARVASAIGRDPRSLLARTKACGTKGAAPSPVCFAGHPFEAVPIASDVEASAANALLERPEAYPGIAVRPTATRTYGSRGDSLAQVAGYLTAATADDTGVSSSGSGVPTLLGRTGVEKQYDAVLRGRDGKRSTAIGPDGTAQRQVADVPPVAGQDVVTSIRPAVQDAAAKALADGIAAARKRGQKAGSGSVVVLEANSGDVVAMTNQPTYDPSVWNGGVTQAEYDSLLDTRAGDPLTNRAMSVAGPPASTFKAFSLFAAAQTGVDPNGSYSCPSSVMIGNRSYSNFESQAHGTIDIPKALEVSCDTVFYRWAYDAWVKAGGVKASTDAPDPYASVAREFGYGARTGVDLPAEASGSLPDRATKRREWEATKAASCRRAKSGYPEIADKDRASYLTQVAKENCTSGYVVRAGDAVNFAIGQGDVAATPMQVATSFAALATNGRVPTPRVAVATARSDGSSQTVLPTPEARVLGLDARMYARELEGLKRAVSTGTASEAFRGFDLDAHPVYGKTGTAEVYGKHATAWFASFGGADEDGKRYVVVVRVDEGGEGGRTAAPIARSVWDALVRRSR